VTGGRNRWPARAHRGATGNKRVFGIETVCQECRALLHLISLIKSEAVAKKILTAMHLPAELPKLRPARPPPGQDGDSRGPEDYIK
jgi:hypothetical protein